MKYIGAVTRIWLNCHELVQNTRSIGELDEQIQKFQILKTSYNEEKFYDDLIRKMSDKRKATEAEMENKRKSILDLPERFEKKILYFFRRTF